jgi:outer membrane lipoprotein-sorting protein
MAGKYGVMFMSIRKRFLLALCSLVLQVSTGQAQETLESVMSRMKPQTVVKIHYEETRHLELLDQPWSGSGYFYAMPDGMIKEQWYPQREIMAAKGSKMYYFDPFADVRYQGKMDSEAGFQAIAMKGLMNGDLALLQKFFQVEFISHANDWVLTLTTHHKQLAEQLSKIIISGIPSKPARKIEVFLADGDRHVFKLKKEAEGQRLQSKVTQLFIELQGR